MANILVHAKVIHPSKHFKNTTMKPFLHLVFFVIVLSSCTTAYKSGQTPDDVYFSPVRQQEEYARVENDDKERRYKGDERSYYEEEDRYLRMKVRDRQRWVYLDDYYRDPYAYKYNRYYNYDNCYCNANQYWNRYYNPYYSNNDVYITSKSPVYNKPRTYNLHVFDTPKDNSYNPKAPTTRSREYDRPAERRNSNTGNDMRDIFRNSGSNSSNSSTNNSNTQSRSSTPERTSTPERSSSETKSSSGSTNAPARKN